MFTRCSSCSTVFHITAAELRAADGTVICGACGTTFDALDSLSETRPKDTGPVATAPPQDPAPGPAAGVAGTEAEFDERARDEDEFLEELESLIGGDGFIEGDGFGDAATTADESSATGFPQMEFTSASLREDELPDSMSAEEDLDAMMADEGSRFDESLIIDEPDDAGAEVSSTDEPLLAATDDEADAEDSRTDEPLLAATDDEADAEVSSTDDPLLAATDDEDDADAELDDPFLDPDSVFRIDEELLASAGVAPAARTDQRREPPAWQDDDPDEDLRDDLGDDMRAEPADDLRDEPDGELDGGSHGEAAEDRGDAGDTDRAGDGGVFAWRDVARAPAPRRPGQDARERVPADDDAPESAGEAARAAAATEAEALPEFARQPRSGGGWLRLLAGLLVALLLAGTWAHSQRGKLLRHPMGEAIMTPAYRALGIEVAPDWNPAEFRAVQWQAVADDERPDDLAVAVDFMNMASYAQPYPVIRITLEDRFGRRVGLHDVPPSQYLRDHSRGSRMAAGGRLQTTVVVRDPGGRADGFRVDFCLDLPGRGLECGPAPFR